VALRKSEGKEVPLYFTEIVYVFMIGVMWEFEYLVTSTSFVRHLGPCPSPTVFWNILPALYVIILERLQHKP
jgi:hypothetical protein